MRIPRLFCVLLLAIIAVASHAQTSKEFTGPYPSKSEEPLQRLEKPHRKGLFSHREKGFHYKPPNVKHTAQYEFYKRVARAAKEHQRALRKLAKPQYSNFLYYGHKRKPKKHPPNKMRYCDECGIRH